MNFILAFCISLVITYLVILITQKREWVSRPAENRWNAKTVSLHGGVGIWLSFMIALFLVRGFEFSFKEVIILSTSSAMMLLGLIDDIYCLMPRAKLFFQIIMTVIAMCSGIMFVFSEYFWVNAAFTTLWVIGITNAINLLDNMDGASPGITFICVLSLALLPHHIEPELAQIAIALAGSLAGFLIFNSYPAKIFMGDSGSLFLGNLMALCLLDFSQNISPEIYHTIFHLPSALLIPTLMILTPIVDTTFVTINRKLNGYPISKGDRGHIAHRLSFLFGNDQLSVGLLYSFQLLVCVVIASYNWLLLYPIIGLLLVALRLLTLMTNHQVWPEKFETPQVTWFGWELPQFLSPFNQNEDLASQVQD